MINSVCGIGSTGKICTDIAEVLDKNGAKVKIAYGRNPIPETSNKYAIRVGSDIDLVIHGIQTRIGDTHGLGSKAATEKFIEWIKRFNPDIIHLHNIHGYYININVLFEYLKNCKKKIIWTMHDCWAITGHCAYFDRVECKKWKTGCYKCPQFHDYPQSCFRDNSKNNYRLKKKLFCDIDGLTIVSPSLWLKDIIKKSFLKSYPVEVINNGINIEIFRPTYGNIKDKLGISNKKILLGVASFWTERKGLSDFVKLSTRLSEQYKIVLIGLNKKQMKSIPNNIIGIEKTYNARELAEYYTMADMYINPTYEDNYPTTNLEAIACGTPVISYETGGSGESAVKFGATVKKGDVKGIIKLLENSFIKDKNFDLSIEHAMDKYVGLYERLLS